MSAIKFPDSHWDRSPAEWLRDALQHAGVESGKVAHAKEAQREEAAAWLVGRAFEVGVYAKNMKALLPLCLAARALVQGTMDALEQAIREAGVTSGDFKDATRMQFDVAMAGWLERIAPHISDLNSEAGKLIAQAGRLLAAPPPNPFGKPTGGAP